MQNVTVRPNNSAGLFRTEQLADSPAFRLVWRMRLYLRERHVAAAKPLWYLGSALTLQAGERKRLI